MIDLSGIEEALRCAFCQARFGDVVLNVPCGEAICHDCHDRIESSKSFKCSACNRSHHKPKHGFAESKPLARLSSKRPRVDASMRAGVDALRSFDAREHLSLVCEQLELEAVEAVESSVRTLKSAEEDVLKRIREFRTQRLAALNDQAADEELEALTRDLERFDGSETDFQTRIDALEVKLKDRVLGGLTAVIETTPINLDSFKLRLVIRDKPKKIRIAETPAQTLVGHVDIVFQTVFLSNNRLASCSNDHSIQIWSLSDGGAPPLGPALLGHSAGVSSLALLAEDRLASGSHDHTVKVWCLTERRELRTLSGHERAVVALAALSEGRLASYACDNTIRIWRPLADENQHLMTMIGHDNWRWTMPIGRRAQDDTLVTCSRGDTGAEASVLKVWSPREGRVVQAAALGFFNVRAVVALVDSRVAVGFENGAIELVDLTDASKSRSRADAFKWTLTALVELPDGSLASCGDDDEACAALKIRIWSIPTLELLQTVATGHTDAVECLSMSPDGRSLASASWDRTVKLWPLLSA